MFGSINRIKRRGPRIGIAVICTSLLSACATPIKVVADYDSSADLSQYRSYAWITDRALIAARGSDVPVSPFYVHRIETEIERELTAQGYRRVQPDETPCFVVSFTMRATGQAAVPSRPTHRGVLYARWPYFGPPVGTPQEIHLAGIDIFDGPTRQLVWHGEVDRVTAAAGSTIAEEAYVIIGEFPAAT